MAGDGSFPLHGWRIRVLALIQSAERPDLLSVDGSVMPTRIKLRTPNFMQGLMLSPPERYRRSESHVEVAKILKSVHQPFGVELWAVPFQRFNQDVTR